MDILSLLSKDVFAEILLFLTPKELHHLFLVCKKWKKLISQSSALWKRNSLTFFECEENLLVDDWFLFFKQHYGTRKLAY